MKRLYLSGPITGVPDLNNKTNPVRLIDSSVCLNEAETMIAANAADIIKLCQRLAA
ncbi:hypothetical protein [Pseudomonas sp. NFX98]|uniref:hypothetical protein n=1 Tax=Pseudomonas sp. NFX98 TaxID=3399122 RepID=UPI0039FDA098